jgi:hypothetical protein
MPRLASYDALVTLEVPTLTPDGQGGQALTLMPESDHWVRVERLPGTPRNDGRGVEQRYRVHFREVLELSEHTHIVWRGARLRVVDVRQATAGRTGRLVVDCVRGQGV